jgi:hypothetical protein
MSPSPDECIREGGLAMSTTGITLQQHSLAKPQQNAHMVEELPKRILDIQADTIHQRLPLVIGSAQDVALYEQFLANGRPA